MDTLRSLLITVLVVVGITQTAGPYEYTPDELPQLVSDFELQHELFDDCGAPITNSTVDDIVVIRISGAQPIAGAHDLVIYRDGRYVASRTDVRLPYELRWAFRGLLDGPHTMLLVFTNTEDERGLVHLNLTVQH
jgi:hypothetical protein